MSFPGKKYRQGWDTANPNAGGDGGMKIKWSGVHEVEVQLVKFRESDKYSNNWYIVEFKVLKSDNSKTQVGEIYSWVHNIDEKWYGMPRAKQFVAACIGLTKDDERAMDPEYLSFDEWEESMSDEQPLKGVELTLVTKVKTTENNREITDHEWWPAGTYEQDDVNSDPKDRE